MGQLLTVDEVARKLRLHRVTIRRHIRSGRLKAVRIGRRIRVREEDIELFLGGEEREDKMTAGELRARLLKPPTKEELEQRRRLVEEMGRLREEIGPIDITTARLVRIARREREVLYEGKTWEELLDEER